MDKPDTTIKGHPFPVYCLQCDAETGIFIPARCPHQAEASDAAAQGTQQDPLTRAIRYLEAICIRQYPDYRWAVATPNGYRICDADSLRMFGEALAHLAYHAAADPSKWRDIIGVAMPSWWSPQRQEAWRINTDCAARRELDFTLRFHNKSETQYAADAAAQDFGLRRNSIRVERVTADVTTGKEIMA